MANSDLIRFGSRCSEPVLGAFLPDYCFGAISEGRRRKFEAHLLECDVCWEEVKRLTNAVALLRRDKTLLKSITPAELTRSFGSAAKLKELPFAGHRQHVALASTLYAINFILILFLEVAYQFDKLGLSALLAAPFAFALIFGSSWWILREATAAEARGQRKTVKSLSACLLSAALLYTFVCLAVLPGSNVTMDNTTGWTARLAYLKDVMYILPIAIFFFLLPFHLVIAIQHELAEGKYQATLDLLSGDPYAVSPRGVLYVSLKALWIAAAGAIVLLFIPMTWHLLDSLEPGRYKHLFAVLTFVRLGVYFAFALECLFWYQLAVSELKREAVTMLGQMPRDEPPPEY